MSPKPSLRQIWAKHRITKWVLHPAITLISLLILFLLIFFGTLYQSEHGLYEAQQKFFGYGIVMLGGYVPVPGASLVLWVLAIQLTVTMLLVLPLQWRKLGLWISHLGIFALLVGGFITQVMAVESQMTLAEGEYSQFSTAYHSWELAFWESHGDTNEVIAFPDKVLKSGGPFKVGKWDMEFEVQSYFPNSAAFNSSATGGKAVAINPSGIAMLESRPLDKQVERNTPGILLTLHQKGKKDKTIQLYGLESQPLLLPAGDVTVRCQLRLKHYPLPFSIKLNQFKRDMHPGTAMASGYESTVDLIDKEQTRAVRIYMNHPLRYLGYTFFQASFSMDQGGNERSTFAVVTNPGRVLPYISSLTVFGGLLLHFLVIFVGYARKQGAL